MHDLTYTWTLKKNRTDRNRVIALGSGVERGGRGEKDVDQVAQRSDWQEADILRSIV